MGAQKPGFLRNTSLHTVNSVKNPVSLSECVQDCLNPDKYKEFLSLYQPKIIRVEQSLFCN